MSRAETNTHLFFIFPYSIYIYYVLLSYCLNTPLEAPYLLGFVLRHLLRHSKTCLNRTKA